MVWTIRGLEDWEHYSDVSRDQLERGWLTQYLVEQLLLPDAEGEGKADLLSAGSARRTARRKTPSLFVPLTAVSTGERQTRSVRISFCHCRNECEMMKAHCGKHVYKVSRQSEIPGTPEQAMAQTCLLENTLSTMYYNRLQWA